MAKGIILRVLDGTVLSPKLATALGELLPGYVLETYEQAPNYKKSYTRRVNSLYEAFLFVIDSYPLDPKFTSLAAETLKSYAAECKSACTLSSRTVDDLQKELEQFTAKLVDVLATSWQWTTGKAVKEAVTCLNDAECYQLMMNHGRPDLATLTTIGTGSEQEYVLQIDESIPPHYKQLLTELELIKTKKYPKTPSWFVNLPEYQQAYFCNLTLEVIGPTEIARDLNTFIAAWEEIKRKSFNLTMELKQIHSNAPPFASWFNELSVHLKAMVKILAVDPAGFKQKLLDFKVMLIEQATKAEFRRTVGNVAVIPQWYWVLPGRQQYFLEHVLKNAPTTEEAVLDMSSRHRFMPVPSNLAAHRLIKINAKSEVIPLYDRRYRSSHIVSREGFRLPEAVQVRHSDANLEKVMEQAKPGTPCLLQTLISPIYAVEYVPGVDYLVELPPDLDLFKMARSAVDRSKRGKDIWQHNHPFNIAKRYYYTEAHDPDSLALLVNAKKFVSKTPGLQALLDDYKNVLESPLGSATFLDYQGRELFLSSLEQLIVLTLGGFSYGSCVSGKDRKAIELLHTDAMMLYQSLYGSWPKYGEPKEKGDREQFVTLFVALYVSRHQHEHAGQNAPGSEGIKTPGWYLPRDMADAINKFLGTDRGLDRDDRLATNNDVPKISKVLKSYLLPANELRCKLMAKQLGEATCTKLYDALSVLVNETRRFQKETWTFTWHKKEASLSPKGIDAIKAVMHDENGGKDNVLRLGKIFAAVLSRPEADASRTSATNSVYDRIRNLFKPSESGVGLQERAAEAVKEWQQLFEESKEVNVTLVC